MSRPTKYMATIYYSREWHMVVGVESARRKRCALSEAGPMAAEIMKAFTGITAIAADPKSSFDAHDKCKT